ncbi:MAG TPA: NTF2-like N-terminal transpeptidase domain-containing protein, partial [Actinomycetota bacterium]
MKGTRISFRTGGKHRRLPFTEQRDPFFKATALRRRRWPKVTGILVAAAIVVGGAVVWQVHHSGQARIRAALERTATGYLSAWGHRDVASMKRLVQPPVPKAFSALNQELFDGLRVGTAAFTAGSIGDPGASSQAIVPFTARLELLGLGTWTYHGRLTLGRAGDLWRVRWTPATVYPGLTPSLALARTRSWPQRAPILARDGNPLTIQGDVVTIGVVPGHIQSRHEVFDALQRYTGVDPAEVKAAIDAPGVKPNWFVPVITLRRQRYEQVRAKLYPVPGIFFHEGRGRILIQEGFAQQVVGRVGDVTAEELKRLGQPYEAGDIVGQYGLEEAFERQLAGRPGGTIELRKGKKVVRTLARFGAIDPKPLQTTLDIDTQR